MPAQNTTWGAGDTIVSPASGNWGAGDQVVSTEPTTGPEIAAKARATAQSPEVVAQGKRIDDANETWGGNLKQIGKGLSDPFIGVAKGAGSTLYNSANLVNKGMRAVLPESLSPSPFPDQKPAMLSPEGPIQKLGYGAEQVGEFMLPGGAEEQLASKAPGILAPIAKVGLGALSTGAVNKLQGRDFTTGALAGAAGQGLAAGVKTLAPSVAESALNISRKYRMFNKTPGAAAIAETTGIMPGAISEQASKKALALTSQLETLAGQSTAPASVAPAVQVVDKAIATATKENTPGIVNQLSSIRDQLTHDLFSNPPAPLPTQRSATDILNLKRGIGKMVRSWSVDERKGVQAILPQVYGALDAELDATVPGADQLNQRISSLIGVKTRAGATAEGASIAQRSINRVARATGAGVGAIAGGTAGYHEGGVPGAIAGGAVGLVAPEILASPGTQMFAARAMSKAPILARPLTGAALQLAPRDTNSLAP